MPKSKKPQPAANKSRLSKRNQSINSTAKVGNKNSFPKNVGNYLLPAILFDVCNLAQTFSLCLI